MNNKLSKLLLVTTASLNITTNCMEQQQQQLPSAIKSKILAFACQGESMAEILEKLKNCAKVSKEFAYLAKSLAYDPEAIDNLAKTYIEEYPEKAIEELDESCRQNNIGVLKALINANINVNVNSKRGSLPLAWAVLNSNINIVQLLLDKGADANAKTGLGNTALMFVSDRWIGQLLLKSGADINAKGVSGNTALIDATQCVKIDIVKFLLENGADREIQNDQGKTALMVANHIMASVNPQAAEKLKQIMQLLENFQQ